MILYIGSFSTDISTAVVLSHSNCHGWLICKASNLSAMLLTPASPSEIGKICDRKLIIRVLFFFFHQVWYACIAFRMSKSTSFKKKTHFFKILQICNKVFHIRSISSWCPLTCLGSKLERNACIVLIYVEDVFCCYDGILVKGMFQKFVVMSAFSILFE